MVRELRITRSATGTAATLARVGRLASSCAVAGLPVGRENLRPGARGRCGRGRLRGVLVAFQLGEPQPASAAVE
jgi:hypothetical protein